MEREVAFQLCATRRALFCELICGFFKNEEGKIFFTGVLGRFGIAFPVGENGLISRNGIAMHQLEPIEMLIRPREFGISEIRWNDS